MSTYYQNRTGYDGFGEFSPNNYYNEYNKTNALHLKYQNMNQTEVPQMKFANRQGSLNLNLIKKLDLNYVIKTNNIIPLEKLSQNLIYSEIKDEDYEDQNIPKLLRTFQYALEYLNEKQSKLEATNNKLNIEYNQLINQSYELEEKLKTNKRQIAKNSSDKKEREMILITYESIVNFNCNPIENTNLIYNNLHANYGEYISNENMGMDGYAGSIRGRFYCHICNGKYFKTESGLENHMKKRHKALMEKKSREKEEKREEEMQDYYDKKIEETKNYLQNMIQHENNELFSRTNYMDEIKRIKIDNEQKLNNIIANSKINTEEMKNIFQTYINKQEENNRNIINLAKAANKERENNEPQKIIIENQSSNEINKLTNSISQLGELLKYHNDRNNNDINEENKILRNKIEILENRSKIINSRINLNNQYDNMYTNQNNNNIPYNDLNQDNFRNKNNIPNNYINIGINQKSNNNLTNNNIPGTNIINDNGHNPESNNNYILNQTLEKNSQVQNPIQRDKKKDNDYQDPNQEDKKLINSILSESITQNNNNQQINNNPYNQNNQDNQDNKNTQFSNTADNFYNNNNNVIKIHQDENPYLNQQKNINNFNKTDPMLFKKRNYKPLQLKKDLSHSGSMKELDLFYKNFMDRDQPIYQPILVNKKPNAQEYLKEIIPPEKKIETTDEHIENRIKNRTNKLLENLENNDKKELMNAIEKTMENINEINNKNQVSQFYYEIAQKAFDLKLLEEDEKMMRNAYDNKGVLKRSRSSSRAKITIQQSENENFY